jgi:hypothetical protein
LPSLPGLGRQAVGHDAPGPCRGEKLFVDYACDLASEVIDRLKPGKGLGNAGPVGGVRFGAVGDVPLLDMLRGAANLAGAVVEQGLPLFGIHHAEQIARLLEVVIVDPVVPVVPCATVGGGPHGHRRGGRTPSQTPSALEAVAPAGAALAIVRVARHLQSASSVGSDTCAG